MTSKLFGLALACGLFISSQAQATTYLFDTPISGSHAPAGSVEVSVSGATATFDVLLPAGLGIYQFGLNLNPGATVSGAGFIQTSSGSFGSYGPFNTMLIATSWPRLNELTFTVSNYAGIFNFESGGLPIWFGVSFMDSSWALGSFASDDIVPETPVVTATPLPGALPLFAGGAGIVGGLAGWRRKRKKALAAA